MLRLKCTKFDYRWGSAPNSAGELTVLPRLPCCFKGSTSKGKMKGKLGEGRKEDGKKEPHENCEAYGPAR